MCLLNVKVNQFNGFIYISGHLKNDYESLSTHARNSFRIDLKLSGHKK